MRRSRSGRAAISGCLQPTNPSTRWCRRSPRAARPPACRPPYPPPRRSGPPRLTDLPAAPMRYWLLMPAAGAGRRFGSAKQFAALQERTVLEVALQPFIDDRQCQGGAIALSPLEPRRLELKRQLPARFELI